ncbi:nitrate/nitrite transporter [Rhodonellum sp.]|uniref:MFS transporter n=1 Tax=Rhodonellum sp. TaxID=2231180 RepID=UPI0027254A75|nr:MFS transporter [Rhodonellum sp.]MDO9554263.1 MFS transporter [Rhodonellum sp.]
MRLILPIIVLSQFLCTSLWFAGNSIVADIARDLGLGQDFLAHQTSMIQFGFISGTLVFAILAVSDRFSPSLVFFASALLAGFFNLGISINDITSLQILLFRFLTGFFLAGIYPVGMKIASDHYEKGLGKSLGFLVGALVLGTAFPHLLKDLLQGFPWKYVIYITTSLSVLGGLSIFLFVPDGPFRKVGQKIKLTAFLSGFKNPDFRAASFGYFGHMWELYTFWAFVPIILASYNALYPAANLNVPLYSFAIIASGGLACMISGWISQWYGVKKIATLSLLFSCLCCLASPIFLFSSFPMLLVAFLFLWGIVVVADSPLFSTLVAQNAPASTRGTALTVVNCIGFSITILSIQLVNSLTGMFNSQYIYMILAIGPLLGLAALLKKNPGKKTLMVVS